MVTASISAHRSPWIGAPLGVALLVLAEVAIWWADRLVVRVVLWRVLPADQRRWTSLADATAQVGRTHCAPGDVDALVRQVRILRAFIVAVGVALFVSSQVSAALLHAAAR